MVILWSGTLAGTTNPSGTAEPLPDEPIRCGYDWFIDQRTMTDPKKAEAQNEELDLEQLEEAAGAIGGSAGPGGTTFLKQNVGGTAGPGGTSYPKTNVAGSANPGGDDI